MNLEVYVNDNIKVVDSLGDAICVITEAFNAWFNSDDTKEFRVEVRKVSNNSPPALGVNVNDESLIVDRLV